MAEVTMQQKIKTISKLNENGITTEKDLLALNIESAYSIPGIVLQDFGVIAQLQKSIKENKLYSYLSGGDLK